ncbi:MAG TPA: hypothetical protein VGC41_03450 [Kofleriaceae bacterium]
MPEQLTRKQVELVLRRAAELEQRDDDAADGLTPQDLERVADELGMSQDALSQALAESRAGALVADEERTLLDRVFGRRVIEARRFVPGNVANVRAAVDGFLEEQGFEQKRNLGQAQVWELGRDWRTRVRRAFKAGSYRLPRDIEIEVRVADVPGGSHPVLVALRIDTTRARSARIGAATTSLIAGGVGIVAGALLLPMPTELIAIGGGGLAGVGGSWLSRSSYRNECARLTVAVERFLDFLEHEPPATSPRAMDPVKRLVEFFSRDWWR